MVYPYGSLIIANGDHGVTGLIAGSSGYILVSDDVIGVKWISPSTVMQSLLTVGPTGATGPIGETGSIGPTGPTGPTFNPLYFLANNPQNINSGTVTSWTEVYDSSNMFNSSTGVFTSPSNGLYSINSQITFSSQLISALAINVNETRIASSSQTVNLSLLSNFIFTISVSILTQLSTNDNVAIVVSGNSNLNLYTTDATRSNFYVIKYS
ncbi:collagen triple helix repeat motif-containing protein [Catovirus CTV1]|uniref:Collagen triple helix repeat motif-containing protein n=1 Tax=Catovirus CTV1 TaxID=1977631 RepID=A0A1V0SAH0_9VIRU|nr:collagen triple helix repeat motif-containing protein [Catovirus CTV1]